MAGDTHNPIVRVTTASGEYTQFSVDPDGQFTEEDQVIPDMDPEAPTLNIAAVFGEYDIKIVWYQGKGSPTVTVNDMSPGTIDPGTGPVGGLGG